MGDKLIDEDGNVYSRNYGGDNGGCGLFFYLLFIFVAVSIGAFFLWGWDILTEKQMQLAIAGTGWLCIAIFVGVIGLGLTILLINTLWDARWFILTGLGIAAVLLFIAWLAK